MAAISEGIILTPPFDVRKEEQKRNFYNSLAAEPWYPAYNRVWKCLKLKLQKMRKEISTNLVNDVVEFVNKCSFSDGFIPTLILFTGTNLPDHDDLFNSVINEICSKSNNRVVSLPPSRSSSVKYLIEYLVSGFMLVGNSNIIAENVNVQDDVTLIVDSFKKPRYSLPLLLDWYRSTFIDKLQENQTPFLITVLPDIESFSSNVLQQFLLALSVYKDRLPILLIFGVATNLNTINDTLSDEVMSKLTFHLFQSQPSVAFLNTVLEKVFLTSNCPFQLGSKVFEFLTHLFLYYNFSVEMFIRGLRFCLMNHFFGSDISVLCCSYRKIPRIVNSLRKKQRAELLKIPSFRKFWKREHSVEELPKPEVIISLLKELHDHLSSFHLTVRCLHELTNSLPSSPLGFHIREIYVRAMDSDITKTTEFKKCFELLKHLSKDELLMKINIIIELLTKNMETVSVTKFLPKFYDIKLNIENSDSLKPIPDIQINPRKRSLSLVKSRSELTRTLANNIAAEKKLTSSEIAVSEFTNFLIQEFFKTFLKPPSEIPLNEILVCNSVDVLRHGFEGIPRATLHHAMVNPCSYLHCDCCSLSDKDGVLNSFPDLCIAYKLHLECGNQINLYDWLQAFSIKVEKENSNSDLVNPQVHARFLQTIKELQFLGFIDSSARKQDHVKKVTSC